MLMFVYQLVVIAGLFAAEVVFAGDGDLNYSAPYITVDPETGQLVTKNPGPHLKMHSQDPSMQMQAGEPDTTATTVASQTSTGSTDDLSMPASQHISPVAIITLVAAGVMVFGVLTFRRLRQR